MVGSIHEEQFIANPRRRTSAHAQRSKCGALSFRASAKIDFRNGRGSVYTPLREKCMTRREGQAPAEPTNSMGAKRIFHGSAGPRPPHEPSGRRISGHQLCASTTRMLFVVRSLEGFPDALRSKRVPGMVFSPENLARLEVLECSKDNHRNERTHMSKAASSFDASRSICRRHRQICITCRNYPIISIFRRNWSLPATRQAVSTFRSAGYL
jgi:hypothetical protein